MTAKKQVQCVLSGYAAQFDAEGRDRFDYDSDICGRYSMTEKTMFALGADGSNLVEITQGNVNCAKKNLEILEESTDIIPYWCLREEFDRITKEVEDYAKARPTKLKFYPVALEDVFDEPVNHAEKALELLKIFGEMLNKTKAYAGFFITARHQIMARVVDQNELNALLSYLYQKKFITEVDYTIATANENYFGNPHIFCGHTFQMTPVGWNQLGDKVLNHSNKVFIATAFEWEENDNIRVSAIEAIKNACRELGYEASTVTQTHTDNITNRIISEIKNCAFLVAELTYHNRGVYFESGFARGIGKPVFHVVRNGFTSSKLEDDKLGKKIHFDIQQVMYRPWENPDDLYTKLKDWIEATLGQFK